MAAPVQNACGAKVPQASSGSAYPSFAICVVVMAVASPLVFWPLLVGASRYDNQRLLELICVLLAGALLVGRSFIRQGSSAVRPSAGVAPLLAVFFSLGLLSAAQAWSPRMALLEWGNLLLLCGMAWLIAEEVGRGGDESLNRILRASGAGCIAYLVLVFVTYGAMLRTGQQPDAGRLIVGFDNYRFFNHVQTMTLPLLGLLAMRSSGQARWLWWAVWSLWWALLFLSAGRGTALGQCVGLVCVALLGGRPGLRWAKGVVCCALGGLLVYLALFVAMPLLLGVQPVGLLFDVVNRSIEAPSSGRGLLWSQALDMIVWQPWLGAGPLHFAHAARALDAGADPHNWVLQIGSEWGVPALLLLLLAVGVSLRGVWRTTPSPGDSMAATARVAWISAGVAIVVDGTVSSLLTVPTSQLWLAVVAGCMWGWCCQQHKLPRATTGGAGWHYRGVLAAVWLLALAGVLYGSLPDATDLVGQQSAAHLADRPGAVFWPRIWINGYF